MNRVRRSAVRIGKNTKRSHPFLPPQLGWVLPLFRICKLQHFLHQTTIGSLPDVAKPSSCFRARASPRAWCRPSRCSSIPRSICPTPSRALRASAQRRPSSAPAEPVALVLPSTNPAPLPPLRAPGTDGTVIAIQPFQRTTAVTLADQTKLWLVDINPNVRGRYLQIGRAHV